jgi:hypothetical protein
VIDRDNGKFHRDPDALLEMIRLGGGGYGAVPTGTATSSSPPAATTCIFQPKFENSGATPAISADGKKNAIVCAILTWVWNGPDNRPAVLCAFDSTKSEVAVYGLLKYSPLK